MNDACAKDGNGCMHMCKVDGQQVQKQNRTCDQHPQKMLWQVRVGSGLAAAALSAAKGKAYSTVRLARGPGALEVSTVSELCKLRTTLETPVRALR